MSGFDVVTEECELPFDTYLRIVDRAMWYKYRDGIEMCGLLTRYRGGRLWYRSTANVAEDPTNSFIVDPESQAYYSTGPSEEKVVGMVHSHPNGEARPSAMDRETYVPEGWLYGVVGFSTGQPVLGMYKMRRGTFETLRVKLV